MQTNNQAQQLTSAALAMVTASTAIGMLASAVQNRVDHLGGWDKAAIKQGIISRRDEGVKRLQPVEEGLFLAMNRAIKELEKTTPKLIDRPSGESVYDLAAILVDELERIINEFKDGNTGAITYSDGYRQALADMQQLMFDQKKTRAAALELLEQKHPLPQDLRQAS